MGYSMKLIFLKTGLRWGLWGGYVVHFLSDKSTKWLLRNDFRAILFKHWGCSLTKSKLFSFYKGLEQRKGSLKASLMWHTIKLNIQQEVK